jgi:hypothetical protein
MLPFVLVPSLSLTSEHVDTGLYLSTSKSYEYGNPIRGHLEVSATKESGKNEEWATQQGIYFPDRNIDSD